MLFTCTESVVLLPSGSFHVPLNTPPIPVIKGVIERSFGLSLLNGCPKKPHNTGAFVEGVRVGEAWICAATRVMKFRGYGKIVLILPLARSENL